MANEESHIEAQYNEILEAKDKGEISSASEKTGCLQRLRN